MSKTKIVDSKRGALIKGGTFLFVLLFNRRFGLKRVEVKEKILKFKETVLKTYSLKSRYTLKVMSKKFRKIDNFNNLSFISRYTLKIMSTGSERTSRFNLFPQIMESYLRQNRFMSISQKNPVRY